MPFSSSDLDQAFGYPQKESDVRIARVRHALRVAASTLFVSHVDNVHMRRALEHLKGALRAYRDAIECDPDVNSVLSIVNVEELVPGQRFRLFDTLEEVYVHHIVGGVLVYKHDSGGVGVLVDDDVVCVSRSA